MSTVQLRPLSFGEVLDGAFTLYRRHFATFFVTALLPQLPVILIWIAYIAVAGGKLDPALQTAFTFGALPFVWLGAVLIDGALVQQSSAAYLGAPVTRRDGYALAFRRFFPMLATAILYWIAVFVGYMFFIVPGVLMMIMFFASSQVTALEGTWGPQALSRSHSLADGAWGRIFGLGLVLWLIVYMPVIATGVGVSVAGPGYFATMGKVASSPVFTAGTQIVGALVKALITPLLTLGMTLQYFDRRVRSEGLDLEMSAPSMAMA
jgi:hypothetical protein